MMWSKLKQTIEGRWADSIRGKIHIYATRYTIGSHWMARAWLTLDGEEIANFSTPDNYNRFGWDTPEMNDRVPSAERTEGAAVEKGEFSRYEFFDSCWIYLNQDIKASQTSDNPIVQAFSILDKRTGKRSLKQLSSNEYHPLVKKLLDLRMGLEGVRLISGLNATEIE